MGKNKTLEELEKNWKIRGEKEKLELLLPHINFTLVKLIDKMPDPSLTPIMMKLIFPLLSLDFPNSSPTKLTLYSLMQHIPIENAYNLPQIVKTTG